jgi:CheY-like chemotaxis protein
LKIAVIDDDVDVRYIIRQILEMDGHDVVEADNGVTGMEIIRSTTPDLIICDVRMPEMTGDELFDALRESESDLGVIPFIFLSAETNKQEQIKRLNKGADNCFQKPVDLKLLAAHVNSQLSRISRISDFVKRKLDAISESLPKTIEHEFSSYKSLAVNTHGYVDAIVSVLHNYHGLEIDQQSAGTKSGSTVNPDYDSATDPNLLPNDIVANKLNYIRYCLYSFNERRKLVRAANGEDLSWTLIFMVAQAQLEGQKIYVSDLYVSISSAKSTINARISSLIEDGIFTKIGDSTDGRRQQILLTEHFRDELMNHIDASIALIKQDICDNLEAPVEQ